MKMFKKFMAVALAGVMALAVLTGCGSSVNEKEIISMINDIQKTPWVQNILDKNDLKATTYKAADADVKQKTAAVAELVQKDVKKEDTIEKILKDKHEDIVKAVVGKDDKNVYAVSYVTKVKYDSKLFNKVDDGLNLAEIYTNIVPLNDLDSKYEQDGNGFIGFKDVTINDNVYTIVIMKNTTQKATK